MYTAVVRSSKSQHIRALKTETETEMEKETETEKEKTGRCYSKKFGGGGGGAVFRPSGRIQQLADKSLQSQSRDVQQHLVRLAVAAAIDHHDLAAGHARRSAASLGAKEMVQPCPNLPTKSSRALLQPGWCHCTATENHYSTRSKRWVFAHRSSRSLNAPWTPWLAITASVWFLPQNEVIRAIVLKDSPCCVAAAAQ